MNKHCEYCNKEIPNSYLENTVILIDENFENPNRGFSHKRCFRKQGGSK